MSDSTLIDRLRRDAQAAIDAAWREAQASADAAWADSQHACEQARADQARDTALRAAELARVALGEAERAARRLRTDADAGVRERLRTLAIAALPQLRESAGSELFATLAGELPPLAYERIRVAPQDVAGARERFPDAQVSSDAATIAGIDAYAAAGRIRIDNTLPTRLDVAWPFLVPLLMRDVRELVDDR
jgi:V/A-type H+-transporting ATPase subunit E